MTAPAKAAKTTAPKTETVKSETPDTTVSVPEQGAKKSRIPELLSNESILGDFCQRYLDIFDEIAEYNKAVLAEKDAEWNATKVLDKARSFARPTEKGVEPKQNVKDALDKWESLVNEALKARKAVLDITAAELGITLNASADRDPETEGKLKEKRKIAVEIGSQLGTIAKLTSNEKASDAVTEFLENNPLPAIGRDQVRSFANDGATTPKYRVKVEVSKDGNVLLSADGFTKTALALTKSEFGYERGKAPKSDDLRGIWEKAGNSVSKTVQEVVEFEDNGLRYVITKK